MKRVFSLLLSAGVGMMFSACGAAPQILIPSYTAPKEVAKLSKIETRDEFISDGAYLALWLNPTVARAKETNPKLASLLIDSVKASLTQTNFITLDPLGGDEGVALNMKVVSYDYKSEGENVSMYLEVSFALARGSDEFLVKKYSDRKNRQSKDKTKLPTENQLASDAVAKVVKDFISDISPLKTRQLREFKPLPKELEAVIAFATRKNYKGAIKLMNNYTGEKDMNFHYNLAILFEAEASVNENLKLLKYAEGNYETAMALGGMNDEVIMSAKARFDNFYELLDRTKKQDVANQALRDDRDAMTGSSDSEYR